MRNNLRFFFALSALGAALGTGSIWMYPYYSFRHTGLFFIPYIAALLLLGIPLLMLEFSAGQYFKKNIIDMFAKIRKGLGAIGWLMVFNAFIVMSYYAVLVSWHIIYFFVSFGLQWKKSPESYFFNNVLQASWFSGFSSFSLPVFIALIMAWVVIFFSIRRGFESLKKAFLVMLPAFAALLLFFFIYSLSIDNALAGVYYFLKPNIKGLLDFSVWADSFSLAIWSLGLSFGFMHAFAGKAENGFILANSLLVAGFKLMASIAVGFIMFGIIGFLSVKNAAGMENLASPGLDFQFVNLAGALPLFYKPALLSILFFVFLGILFMLGAVSLSYSISHVLVHKFKARQRNAAILVCGLGFLFGLLFAIKPGFYIMDIAGHFAYYNILAIVLLEAIAVGWIFESRKIADFINYHSTAKIGNLWKFVIQYIVPIIVLLLIMVQIAADFSMGYKNYPMMHIMIFGIGVVAVPLIAAFLLPQRIFGRG